MMLARLALLFLAALFSASAARAQCTNCTVTAVGSDVVLTFTANGTFTPPSGITSVRYLVVAGGAGGGGVPDAGNIGGAGGGGAGGYLAGTGFAVTPLTVYNVTVGAGGAPGVGGTSQGGNGGNSVFSTLTAVGGGGGASAAVSNAGEDGGSGGGGRITGNPGGSGVAGQGNDGGAGNNAAGGGGGAGSAGANGGAAAGGAGGNGVSNDITGVSVSYATGGAGGNYGTRAAGISATANSGNGGGGASGANGGFAFDGGAGGSGIVVIRYTPPTVYYSRNNGTWNGNNRWSLVGCGGATAGAANPGAGDVAVICNGHTVTLNISIGAPGLASLAINPGGTLNIGNNNTARTLTVGGDVDNAGTLRYNNNNGNHAIDVSGDFINSGTFGTINNTNGGQRSLTVDGLIDNSGTFRYGGRANAGQIITVNANGGIVNSGTFDVDTASDNTHALNVRGNLVNNGTFDLATDANSLVDATFDGAIAQTISGSSPSSNFHNLTLDNASGLALSGGQSIVVNSSLTLASGRLTTNANAVHITSGNAVGNAGASTFVVGNLRRTFTGATSSQAFEVGTEAGGVRYAPVEVQLGGVAGSGAFTVSSTAGDHPNVAASTLDDTLSVNRHWTLNNDSVSFGGTATVTFNYVGADVDVGADFNEFYVGRYVAPDWTEITPSARAATAITIDGVVAAAISGAYQIAQRRQVLTLVSATLICGATDQVEVVFSTAVTAASATNIANYALDGGATISGAVLDASGQIVTLATSALETRLYTLTVNNVQAAPSGPVIAPNSQATFFSEGGYLSGLLGSYFANMTLSGTPAGQRIDGPIDFDWGIGTPGVAGIGADNFSVRWEGFVTPTVTGTYTFRTRSDDGVRLYLDGALIIDNWTDHAATNDDSAPVALTAGQRYAIVMEYYENGGQAVAQLSWSGPGTGGFQFIPRANLSHFCGLPRPVALYTLDQSAWSAAGDVTDSSGNGLHGTAFGGATPVPAQVCNGSLHTGGDEYLQVNHDARLNMTGSFTVAAWINASALGTELKTIVSKDENYEFHLTNAGQINWWWQNSGGTAQTFTTTGAAIVPGTWYHVAVVYQPGNQVIYIDGVSRGTATFAGGLLTNTDPLQIGADQYPMQPGRVFDGRIDEVRVYDQALTQAQVIEAMNVTRPCAVTLDHFSISHAGSGVACDTHQITFTAHDASHNPVDAGALLVNLSTSNGKGTWTGIAAGGGTLSGVNPGLGTANYQFAVGANSVTLNFRYADLAATSETFNFNISGGGYSEATGNATVADDPPFAMAQAGFRFNNVSDGNTTIPVQISGKPSNTGWNAKTIRIQAIRTDTATGACTALFASQSRTVELGAECNSPATCAGRQVSVNGGSIATSNDNAGPGAAAYSGVSLAFNAASEADTVIAYPDAGQISLHARFDLDPDVAGYEGIGATNPFIVRPFGLAFPGVSHASTATGTLLAAAGDPFSMTVQAYQWAPGEDADNNGVPDAGVNITDNGTVPNFAATVSVSAAANLPGIATGSLARGAGCADPPGIALAGGTASAADWCYSEAGNVRLAASVSNYLAAGVDVSGDSGLDGDAGGGYVGRFRPKHFTVTGTPTLTNRSALGCAPASSFTYMNEGLDLDFTLEARNAQNALTQNYTGAYARLSLATAATLGLGARSGATNLTGRVDASLAPSGSFTNGVANLVVTTAIRRASPDTPDGPFPGTQFGIAPVDPDGTAMQAYDLDVDGVGGDDHFAVGAPTELRFGRLRLQNGYGPVNLPVRLALDVQHWSGGAFVTNGADSCTTLARSDLAMSFGGALAACETAVQEATIAFASGAGALTLAAPGAGNQGTVRLTANLGSAAGSYCPSVGAASAAATASGAHYLLGRWNETDDDGDPNTAYDDKPAGQAAFGLYGSQPKNFIFLRENY